jgi:hypothetical protein
LVANVDLLVDQFDLVRHVVKLDHPNDQLDDQSDLDQVESGAFFEIVEQRET